MEVLSEVERDSPYYGESGGLTLSGGEPLSRIEFAVELFKHCRARSIHTALETSGYASVSNLNSILPWTDLVLLDLKLMDLGLHRYWTGQPNEIILENGRRIAQSLVPLVIRVPVIPGVNDADANLRATADFVLSLGRKVRVELLPYHRAGEGKYQMLDRPYALQGTPGMSAKDCTWVQSRFTSYGLECGIIV